MSKPRVTRVYQNHHLDSTRWRDYRPRPDDIIVTTSYKAGTTFTQQILLHLLYGTQDPLPEIGELSPWIDARFMPVPLEQVYAGLEQQQGRRFIKSHLALDGLPYFEQVKYLVVARDPRDVFMSLVNHYGNYSDMAYMALNGGDRVGDSLPRISDDIHELWQIWISRGWFEWESEGYPFWGNMHHTQSYWDYRHLPNFLFVHYADLLADLEGSVRRIAAFLDREPSEEDVARVLRETNFASAKKKAIAADESAAPDEPRIFEGGQTSFIFKGTNGRWKDVLGAQDLELYEQAKRRVLAPDCARWLEQGGAVEKAH